MASGAMLSGDGYTIDVATNVKVWLADGDTLKPVAGIVSVVLSEELATVTAFPGSGVNVFHDLPYSDIPVAGCFTFADVVL